jgi:hypothetical protein
MSDLRTQLRLLQEKYCIELRLSAPEAYDKAWNEMFPPPPPPPPKQASSSKVEELAQKLEKTLYKV